MSPRLILVSTARTEARSVRDPKTLVESDSQPDGFHRFLSAVRDEGLTFGVLSSTSTVIRTISRIDKPLLDPGGARLRISRVWKPSVTTREHGVNDMHWVKVLVDPSTRDVFAFQEQIVSSNRTAVPNP